MINKNLENYLTYGSNCTKWNNPCDYTLGLVCSVGVGTNCSCPNTYGVNKCDCDVSQYWNNTQCTDRKSINGTCSATYMCKAYIGLNCSAAGVCECATSSTYWETTNAACRELNLFEENDFIL